MVELHVTLKVGIVSFVDRVPSDTPLLSRRETERERVRNGVHCAFSLFFIIVLGAQNKLSSSLGNDKAELPLSTPGCS